ncbi:MAG: AAA family ATPase, partial [Bacteroidaceae bacterium]|nr:AAA family ATPase [Bacteroidaceae bacterium]
MSSNPELDLARRIVENTGTHLFLTGKAGTGKTTFLKDLKKRSPKRMVVTAPTGIAAINAGGMTLHSFFQLPLAPYVPDSTFRAEKDVHRYKFSKEKKRLIRSLDLLVIDEISMVRADILDAVDAVLRRFRQPHLPFGGVQLLMIGDLQQLAPVVKPEEWDMLSQYYDTPFFFSSRALSETHYATVELKQTYRQTDEHFLALLNNIRTNRADAATLEQLNRRYIPEFTPPASPRYIRLTTHNVLAQSINDRELGELDTPT